MRVGGVGKRGEQVVRVSNSAPGRSTSKYEVIPCLRLPRPGPEEDDGRHTRVLSGSLVDQGAKYCADCGDVKGRLTTPSHVQTYMYQLISGTAHCHAHRCECDPTVHLLTLCSMNGPPERNIPVECRRMCEYRLRDLDL
eukprot:1177786-Prorocentrum_minimum.AAC.2